ncbi:MAG: GatB/YqeY domain-containing protein [Burkholderiales bacterium]|nr:GatB/YqeY domain-containing protein [Burkholderiales bacterium]OJX00607.1 MAG: glutamyl-tRNA amidotransferase [Burkholderiales bacterium 70-64]
MNLKERIGEDMKAALRARDTARLSAIRMLLAAVKQKEIDERITVDDAQVIAIVDKLIRQRRESIAQFGAAGRQDLVDREQGEIDVLSAYLPKQADAAEVAAEIDAAVASTGAVGPQDMGKVMGVLKQRLAGRADLSAVSAQVKARLARP